MHINLNACFDAQKPDITTDTFYIGYSINLIMVCILCNQLNFVSDLTDFIYRFLFLQGGTCRISTKENV